MKILLKLFFVIMLFCNPLSVNAQCGFRFSEYILNENTAPVAVDQVSTTFNPEVLYTQSISVYPNPCTDWLVVNSSSEHTFILTDIAGKIVFSSTSQVVFFSTQLLPPGFYFLLSDNGFKKMVIKQ